MQEEYRIFIPIFWSIYLLMFLHNICICKGARYMCWIEDAIIYFHIYWNYRCKRLSSHAFIHRQHEHQQALQFPISLHFNPDLVRIESASTMPGFQIDNPFYLYIYPTTNDDAHFCIKYTNMMLFSHILVLDAHSYGRIISSRIFWVYFYRTKA